MKLKGTTFGDTLGPAMEITDQGEADDYYAQLVKHYMILLSQVYNHMCEAAIEEAGRTRLEAEQIVRSNLGYYAGYYGEETQVRVNRLFKTTHPVFGDKRPTPEEALEAGKKLAEGGGANE